MVKVLKAGRADPFTKVDCKQCDSTLEVCDSEWKIGTYGSERYVSCPVCQAHVIRRGTGYTGDF